MYIVASVNENGKQDETCNPKAPSDIVVVNTTRNISRCTKIAKQLLTHCYDNYA